MRTQEVTSERVNGVVGERDKAYSSGLGGLDDDARVLGGGDGSFDANGGIIEVDIRPAKCADLASSSARCDCNLEPGGQTRVSVCGCCQQVPDHGDGGRVDDRTRNLRPGRNRHRIARTTIPNERPGPPLGARPRERTAPAMARDPSQPSLRRAGHSRVRSVSTEGSRRGRERGAGAPRSPSPGGSSARDVRPAGTVRADGPPSPTPHRAGRRRLPQPCAVMRLAPRSGFLRPSVTVAAGFLAWDPGRQLPGAASVLVLAESSFQCVVVASLPYRQESGLCRRAPVRHHARVRGSSTQ